MAGKRIFIFFLFLAWGAVKAQHTLPNLKTLKQFVHPILGLPSSSRKFPSDYHTQTPPLNSIFRHIDENIHLAHSNWPDDCRRKEGNVLHYYYDDDDDDDDVSGASNSTHSTLDQKLSTTLKSKCFYHLPSTLSSCLFLAVVLLCELGNKEKIEGRGGGARM